MKYQGIKICIMIICMLAAGICYSCSRERLAAEGIILTQSGSETGKPETESEDGLKLKIEETTVQEKKIYYVHICGEVAAPGVYEMEEGDRIFQVVERAGGFTQEAAVEYLNMAELVSDGMKLVVPNISEIDSLTQYGGQGSLTSGSASTAKSKVNLNTADKEQLMTLKGVGEAKAEDIIRYRQERGPFQRIEDIKKISGIKDAAFDKIKDDITV